MVSIRWYLGCLKGQLGGAGIYIYIIYIYIYIHFHFFIYSLIERDIDYRDVGFV